MSMAKALKGDYIGFTYDDIHSSELGLIRVSEGSRYNSSLLPTLQDKTSPIVGRDGEVLLNSSYGSKEIKFSIAFDNLTEHNLRRLIRLLADKKPKSLWFDEAPYKEWIVKSSNVQDLKWICFDESREDKTNNEKKRIYKGEGVLTFKCYSAYAQSRVTFLDEPVDYIYTYTENNKRIIRKNGTKENPVTLKDNYNFLEWEKTSGLVNSYDENNGYETWEELGENEYYIFVRNCGDIETNFLLKYVSNSPQEKEIQDTLSFALYDGETPQKKLSYKIKLQDGDVGFIIDTKMKLIKGIDQYGKCTNNIYNKYITEGDFFKFPPSESYSLLYSTLIYDSLTYKHYYI